MSVILMGKIWRADLPAMDKIVLLKMADCAHDDGQSVWPSVATIQRECGCSERHVQNVIKRYTDTGLLVLVKAENDGRKTREYAFSLSVLDGIQVVTPAPGAPVPPHPVHPTPAPGAPKQLVNRHRNHQTKRDGADAPSKVVELEAKRPAREYAFYGEVVRLKPKDYDRWKERFYAIPDFDAMLGQIDEHYAANPGKRKSWFHAASGWLQNEHQKRMEKQARDGIARQKQREAQAREERWEAMTRQGGEAAKQAREEHDQWQEERIAMLRKRKAEREARHDA